MNSDCVWPQEMLITDVMCSRQIAPDNTCQALKASSRREFIQITDCQSQDLRAPGRVSGGSPPEGGRVWSSLFIFTFLTLAQRSMKLCHFGDRDMYVMLESIIPNPSHTLPCSSDFVMFLRSRLSSSVIFMRI